MYCSKSRVLASSNGIRDKSSAAIPLNTYGYYCTCHMSEGKVRSISCPPCNQSNGSDEIEYRFVTGKKKSMCNRSSCPKNIRPSVPQPFISIFAKSIEHNLRTEAFGGPSMKKIHYEKKDYSFYFRPIMVGKEK